MPDDQHGPPCAGGSEAAAIEAALTARHPWTPGMEALFERADGPARRDGAIRALVVGGIILLCVAVLDALVDTTLLVTALPWRLGCLGLVLACAAALRRLPQAPRVSLAEVLLTTLPNVAMMAVTELIGEHAPFWGDRYMLGAAFGLAGFVATTPMTLPAARCLVVVALFVYPLVLAMLPLAISLAGNWDLPIFTTGVLGTALLVCKRNGHARRRDFLHRRRYEIAAAELNLMNDELLRLSRTDPLTGLQNRRAFTQALSAHWQDRRQTLALAIIDVDWFKAFNDSAGHAAGDAALQAVATAASRGVRRGVDVIARIGGEEFGVLMPGLDRDQALALGEKLCREVSALGVPHPGRPGRTLSISVGMAWRRAEDRACHTQEAFMHEADTMLYAAKAAGRDRVILAEAASALPAE